MNNTGKTPRIFLEETSTKLGRRVEASGLTTEQMDLEMVLLQPADVDPVTLRKIDIMQLALLMQGQLVSGVCRLGDRVFGISACTGGCHLVFLDVMDPSRSKAVIDAEIAAETTGRTGKAPAGITLH